MLSIHVRFLRYCVIGFSKMHLKLSKRFSLFFHTQAWLAFAGIVSVGLSIGVSIALCSAFGLFYGPAHAALPFLLLGTPRQ